MAPKKNQKTSKKAVKKEVSSDDDDSDVQVKDKKLYRSKYGLPMEPTQETKFTKARKKIADYAIDIDNIGNSMAAIGATVNPYIAATGLAVKGVNAMYQNHRANVEAERQRKYMIQQGIYQAINPDMPLPRVDMPMYESQRSTTPFHNMSAGKNDTLIDYNPPRSKLSGILRNGLTVGATMIGTALIQKAVDSIEKNPKNFLNGASKVVSSVGNKAGDLINKGMEAYENYQDEIQHANDTTIQKIGHNVSKGLKTTWKAYKKYIGDPAAKITGIQYLHDHVFS